MGTNSPRGSPALEVGAGQVAVRRLFRGARLLIPLICKYIDSHKKESDVEPIRQTPPTDSSHLRSATNAEM